MPNRIRVLREAAGWTIADLQRRCPGVTKVRIKDLDDGPHFTPKISTAAMLAHVFGVQVMDLCTIDANTASFIETGTPPTPEEKKAIQAALRALKNEAGK